MPRNLKGLPVYLFVPLPFTIGLMLGQGVFEDMRCSMLVLRVVGGEFWGRSLGIETGYCYELPWRQKAFVDGRLV